MEQKVKLDDLPSSDDKEFWAEADIHRAEPKVHFLDQKHCLIRISGHQAKCTHCDWGFQLEPGDKIIDGHLVDKEGKLVI